MKQDPPKEEQQPFVPPVSAFAGPIAELVGHRLLSPPTRPGLLANLARFEVLRILGGGGMGVVILARDSENGKEVAIKLIRPELVSDQRMVHRFVKEAGHLQKLKHTNIVPVLEVSDRPEGPYFVMPYFGRGSLASRIRPGVPLETEVIFDLARQVADGLAFAHRHGIIHRDLKPANILLDEQSRASLADFGLARTLFNDSIIDVEREQLEGTAPYMSPGVAAGHAEDTRCDIYAFGALLYEMLTGEPPYAGRSTSDIRGQIMAGPPKPILERNPAADPGLVTVAEGAMARELRDRYADMADVVADLERIKAGKPPEGARGSAQHGKGSRSSKWLPAGIALIAAGLWLIWSGASTKTTQATKSEPAVAPATNIPRVTVVPKITPVTTSAPPPAVMAAPDQWQVTLLAGQRGTSGSADGPGAEARFRSPEGIAVDTAGNVYVADTGNNTIRKITPDGSVITLAGVAGKPGRSDGIAVNARFLAPLGIAVDRFGDLFIAEFADDIIRKISADGTVITLAGSAGRAGAEDGNGDNAHFRNPWSVAVDYTGNVYVADKSSFTIRQITPTGHVSTMAGRAGTPGKSDGPGSYARFNDPHSVAVDHATAGAVIYVADTGNNTIRAVKAAGIVSTLAGTPGITGTNDGMGSKALFSNVQSLAVGEAGNIYVLDGERLRKISPDGAVTTLPKAVLTDAQGQPIRPSAITADRAGNLYLADALHNVIWKAQPPKMHGAASS